MYIKHTLYRKLIRDWVVRDMKRRAEGKMLEEIYSYPGVSSIPLKIRMNYFRKLHLLALGYYHLPFFNDWKYSLLFYICYLFGYTFKREARQRLIGSKELLILREGEDELQKND